MLWPFDVKLVPESMHVSLAGSWAKIVYLAAKSPRFTTAWPSGPAVLSKMVTPLRVAVPPSCFIAAARKLDALPLTVTLVSVMSDALAMPPPEPSDTLPLTVTRLSAIVPALLKIPPPTHPVPRHRLPLTVTSVRETVPLSMAIPPPKPAPLLSVTTTFVRTRLPLLMMAPPAAAPGFPLRMVTFEIVAPAYRSNTRSMPFPSMMTVLAAAPVMMRAWVTSRSPVAADSSSRPAMVIVYVPAGMLTVSVPAIALALRIAPRRLQSLAAAVQAVALASSSVRSTVKVAPNAGVPSAMKPRTPRTRASERVRWGSIVIEATVGRRQDGDGPRITRNGPESSIVVKEHWSTWNPSWAMTGRDARSLAGNVAGTLRSASSRS
jgi:hypothetical protein